MEKTKMVNTQSIPEIEEERAKKATHFDAMYHSKNPLVRKFHRKRVEIVLGLVDNLQAEKIIDIGCSEGYLLEKLKGEVWGIEVSETRAKRAKKRVPHAKILTEDLVDLSLDSNAFDAVICLEVLEHIVDYKTAIKELVRIAKKGGRVIISVPVERNLAIARLLMFRFPIYPLVHVNDFSIDDLNAIFGMTPDSIHAIPKWFPMSVVIEYHKK